MLSERIMLINVMFAQDIAQSKNKVESLFAYDL